MYMFSDIIYYMTYYLFKWVYFVINRTQIEYFFNLKVEFICIYDLITLNININNSNSYK